MPCADSSSEILIHLDLTERLKKFSFGKVNCRETISVRTGLNKFCAGKKAQEILKLNFAKIVRDLKLTKNEEKQFVLYLEWEALKSGLAQYLGVDDPDLDADRCQITSIEYDQNGVLIKEVILPPKNLPKILPCCFRE